jgi:hypothetical protein
MYKTRTEQRPLTVKLLLMAAGTARLKKHQPSNGAREGRWAWSLAAESDPIVGSRHEGRCMKRRTIVQRALDYGTDREKPLGFSLKFLKVE